MEAWKPAKRDKNRTGKAGNNNTWIKKLKEFFPRVNTLTK